MKLLERHFEIALETPDGITKLRELILSLAMKGKLVEQNPNDQPASELLKEIEAKKKKLIKEGKIKKQETMPPIKPTEIPYAVPKGWVWCRLDDFAEYNGRPNVSPNEIPAKTWVLDLEDIEKDTSKIINRATNEERQSKSNKSIFFNGDVLYGKLRPYLNKVVVADQDGVCTTEIVPIVPSVGIFPHFLKYLLKRADFLAYVNALSYGVKMPRLGTADALKSLHPLPPFAEQKRIVAKIDQLMDLCNKLEAERNERDKKRLAIHTAAMNRLFTAADKTTFNTSVSFINKNFSALYSVSENVEDLKKAILQLAVMGKLVPQDPKDQTASKFLQEIEAEKKKLIKEGKIKKQEPLPPIKSEEMPYMLPKGWEWVRLGAVVSLLGDGIHGTPKYDDLGEYFFINGNNLSDGHIEIKENTKKVSVQEYNKYKKNLNSHTVLVSINGTIGNVAFYNNEKVILGKSACYFNLFENIDKNYIKKLINTKFFLDYAFSSATGSTIKNVSLKSMREFAFPLPPPAEQKRIVAKVDQLMELCHILGQQINDSTEKQTAILDAVLARL